MTSRVRQKPVLAMGVEHGTGLTDASCLVTVADILRAVETLDAEVERRIYDLLSAAEDSIMSLKNEAKRLLITIPKKIRNMPLADFERQYPDDLKSGALEEIRARYVALAAEAATSLPATTATKRGRSEVPTALRTVRPRRGAAAAGPVIPPPKFADNGVPAAAAGKRHGAGPVADDLCTYQQQHKQFAGRPAPSTLFHGLPLQTPMPFAGEAVPVPVTLLTQKRGGRMRSAAAPDAAIITTADGKQWAVSAAGTEAIPDSHRNEVESLLNAQFEFIAAALGKTVFSRGRR